MGYISNYKPIKTTNYDSEVVEHIYSEARYHCIEIIQQGYQNYLADSIKVFSEDETKITAGLCDHIQSIVETDDLPIEVVPERHQHTTLIKKGLINPNKAKRLDFQFTNFNYKPRIRFGVEAKLIAEKNTSTKRATFLISEYVEDAGMGKFLKGDYEDDGFMVGYILNGKTSNIVNKLNFKIVETYSIQEQINKMQQHYLSDYTFNGRDKKLYHIFLDFSTLMN
jgi:hypothetical protein